MPPKKPLQKDEIEFAKFVPDVGRNVQVRRVGKLYRVGGVDIALFPGTVLAEAIGRDIKTLRRWEREGTFPKPMWKVPDKRCKRWYSMNQIMFMHKLHMTLSKGEYGFAHSPYFPLKEFLTKIRESFRKVDADVVKKKETAHGT